MSTRNSREKFFNLIELPEKIASLRHDGKRVVLAHGVFDLIHMGHVRHLEAAHNEGDILIVSLTDDAHVNKGPGRPIFQQQLRAEMIGALEYVDFVTINPHASAANVLEILRPDIYVKGSDYENPEDDITGNITHEKQLVEFYGGRMVLTKDITFSSSSIINRYMDVYDPPLQDFLVSIRDKGGIELVQKYLDAGSGNSCVLIGETIFDEYRYVKPLGKPSKENIIATRLIYSEIFAGGIIATARHLASFVKHINLISFLGSENEAEEREFISSLLPDNITLHFIIRENMPTTRKIRYVDPDYTRKLFEVYHFADTPLNAAESDNIKSLISSIFDDEKLVIANDFGHGLFTPEIIRVISEKAKFLSVNTQTNAGNHGFNFITRWPRANFVCIDEPEARLAISDKYSDPIEIVAALPSVIDVEKLIITHGQHGCIALENGAGAPIRVPAFTNRVVDTVGAGDAFFAIASCLVFNNCPVDIAGFLGNAAGAIKVGIVGHRDSVHRIALIKFLTAILK